MPAATVAAHFTGKDPVVREIYDRLLDRAARFGPVTEDPKQTSIHLTRGSAFAGVATKRDGIVGTWKSPSDIRSARIVRRLRASANRWYFDVKLTSPAQVDRQGTGWLAGSLECAQ